MVPDLPNEIHNESENELKSIMKSVQAKRDQDESWLQNESDLDTSRFDPELIAQKSQDSDPLVGKVLFGTYKIEKVLGQGAMGIVYLAKHLAFDRYVAMKTLKTDDPDISERFAQEVRVHAQLKHENIVEAIDCLVAPNNQTFFVMEYLEGVELEDLIKAKELSDKPKDVAAIAVQICRALDHSHKKGIIHRDLKPGNIILLPEGNSFKVKVVDFGIAKIQESIQKLTKTGVALGSPLYMSPEQCMGEEVDERSDIYSLGVLLYEAVSGELPHLGTDLVDTMRMHCDPDVIPKPISATMPGFPCINQLDSIILKALSTSPHARYQSCEEFDRAIKFWLDSMESKSPNRVVPGTEEIKVESKPSVSRGKSQVDQTPDDEVPHSVPGSKPNRKIEQPGMPGKPKKKSSIAPVVAITVIFSLIVVCAILGTAFFFQERMIKMQSPNKVPAQTEKQREEPKTPQENKDTENSAPVTKSPESKPVEKPNSVKPKPKKRSIKTPRKTTKPRPKRAQVVKPKSKKSKPKPKKTAPTSSKTGNALFDDLKKSRVPDK